MNVRTDRPVSTEITGVQV